MIAACVDGKLRNRALIEHIYKYPTGATFSSLYTHTGELREAVHSEKNAYESFAALVSLDRKGWMMQSSDRVDELHARNRLALDKIGRASCRERV